MYGRDGWKKVGEDTKTATVMRRGMADGETADSGGWGECVRRDAASVRGFYSPGAMPAGFSLAQSQSALSW